MFLVGVLINMNDFIENNEANIDHKSISFLFYAKYIILSLLWIIVLGICLIIYILNIEIINSFVLALMIFGITLVPIILAPIYALLIIKNIFWYNDLEPLRSVKRIRLYLIIVLTLIIIGVFSIPWGFSYCSYHHNNKECSLNLI